MSHVAVVTDSCCDLSAGLLEAAGVEYVSLSFVLDGTEQSDDLGQTLSYEEFYSRLEAGALVQTAQVPVSQYMEAFERVTADGRPVVYVAFSSAMSGSYDASVLARHQFVSKHPDARIYCVDSKCASAGQGLLVLGAARIARQGASAEEVVRWVEENRMRVNHIFTVDSFEYLVRGGRVSPGVGKVGSVLNINPVMTVDPSGALVVLKKPRGRRRALEMIADMAAGRISDVGRDGLVLVSHGACEEDAEALRALMIERCGLADARYARVGTVIGAHTGPGVLSVFFWGESRL